MRCLHFFDGLKQYYQPMDIADKWKTVIENRAKTDAAELVPESGSFKSWFKEFESNENPRKIAFYNL